LDRADLMRTAQYDRAQEVADDVLVRARELADPSVTMLALIASGRAMRSRDDLDGAQERFFEAIALGERTRAEPDALTEAWLEMLCLAEMDDRELPRTKGLAEIVRARIDAAGGPRKVDAYLTFYEARIARTEGRLEEALATGRRAAELYRQVFGADHIKVTVCEEDIADVLQKLGRYDEAIDRMRGVVAQREAALGPEHPMVANGLVNLAVKLDAPEAIPQLQRAARIYERSVPGDTRRFLVLCNLGEMQRQLGQHAQALANLRTCADGLVESNGADHPRSVHATLRLVDLLAELDLRPEARHRVELALSRGDTLAAESRAKLEAERARFAEKDGDARTW
jgi:tetratricopeptide (TPR) repeat protein